MCGQRETEGRRDLGPQAGGSLSTNRPRSSADSKREEADATSWEALPQTHPHGDTRHPESSVQVPPGVSYVH